MRVLMVGVRFLRTQQRAFYEPVRLVPGIAEALGSFGVWGFVVFLGSFGFFVFEGLFLSVGVWCLLLASRVWGVVGACCALLESLILAQDERWRRA